MGELTSLTLKAAVEGLKSKRFSSLELTQAHVQAIEAARGLNAFVLETPDKALDMAKAADARIASGEAECCGEDSSFRGKNSTTWSTVFSKSCRHSSGVQSA